MALRRIVDAAGRRTGSLLRSGATVGERAVVAAGVVVTKDVLPCCVVAGPVKVVRQDPGPVGTEA